MEKEFLRCEGIYKKINKNIIPVNNVSFTFERSKFYAVMGQSGAGKSTFLQILGLIDTADRGKIIIDGKDASKLSEKETAKYREKYFGFIFQSCFLNPDFNALENVMLPMLLNRDIKSAKRSSEKLLSSFGLSDRKYHYPEQLSGGEQQRTAIARALANDPECIIADEPTGNLDSENEAKVFETLRKICDEQGKCIICVSHSRCVERYADRILIYRKGEIAE